MFQKIISIERQHLKTTVIKYKNIYVVITFLNYHHDHNIFLPTSKQLYWPFVLIKIKYYNTIITICCTKKKKKRQMKIISVDGLILQKVRIKFSRNFFATKSLATIQGAFTLSVYTCCLVQRVLIAFVRDYRIVSIN